MELLSLFDVIPRVNAKAGMMGRIENRVILIMLQQLELLQDNDRREYYGAVDYSLALHHLDHYSSHLTLSTSIRLYDGHSYPHKRFPPFSPFPLFPLLFIPDYIPILSILCLSIKDISLINFCSKAVSRSKNVFVLEVKMFSGHLHRSASVRTRSYCIAWYGTISYRTPSSPPRQFVEIPIIPISRIVSL